MLAFKTYLTKAMDRLFIFHTQKQSMCILHKFTTHNNVLQLLKKKEKSNTIASKVLECLKFINICKSHAFCSSEFNIYLSTDKARMIYKTFIRGCESKLAKYNCE